MLYLEDYLEMIEHLPQELRDRFTDMREMDLGVQNSIDGLEKKVRAFFANAKRLPKNERDAEHDGIRKEYYKTLEDADEKVQLAIHMYDLVDRYLRRLDSELFKFKIELEADNAGITEILEKRSLELDAPPPSSREKENRYTFGSRSSNTHGKQKKRRDSSVGGALGSTEKRHSADSRSGHSSHSSSHSHISSSHGGHRDSHSHRDSHGSHRDNHHGSHRDNHHGSHRDNHHGSHRDSHGSHRDSHGSHRDSHGSHRDSHGGHRDSHGSHRDTHGSHRDGQSHAVYRDSHGVIHRDGHSSSGQVLTYGLAASIGHKDREGRNLFGQSHLHQQQLQSSAQDSTPSRGVPGQAQLQQLQQHSHAAGNVSPAGSSVSSASSHRDRDAHRDNVGYGLGHMGAGGNAIAAAASQAIAATQQIEGSRQVDTTEMQQGRRTASLKASYEAINIGGSHSHDFAIGREIAGAAQTALAAIHDLPKKKKKSSSSNSAHALSSASSGLTSSFGSTSQAVALSADTAAMADSADESLLDPNGDGLGDGENPDWTYDPNEPRYCLCNQVSYGDMVACDNEDCPFEWFHYACVNITAPPKGKWYCPQCSSSMKRRRKN